MMIRTALLLTICGCLAFLARPALAEEDQLLGKFKSWEARKLLRNGLTACYAIAKPHTKLPKGVNRDETYFMVSHWPERDKQGEPSIVAGYPYRGGSKTTVAIGKARFSFFTKGDSAWLAKNGDEVRLVEAMKSGYSMIVKGTSTRGTVTTDSYSLLGFTDALDKAAQACK